MRIDVLVVNKNIFKHGGVLEVEVNGKDLAKMAALLVALNMAAPGVALADQGNITEKVTRAAQPIKDLLLGIADPVCYLVFAWGLLEAMLGKGSSGIQRMKFAALGFAGLNWLPVLMEILRQAKP